MVCEENKYNTQKTGCLERQPLNIKNQKTAFLRKPLPLTIDAKKTWRPRTELNRRKRFCRPMPSHSATWPNLSLKYFQECTMEYQHRMEEVVKSRKKNNLYMTQKYGCFISLQN